MPIIPYYKSIYWSMIAQRQKDFRCVYILIYQYTIRTICSYGKSIWQHYFTSIRIVNLYSQATDIRLRAIQQIARRKKCQYCKPEKKGPLLNHIVVRIWYLLRSHELRLISSPRKPATNNCVPKIIVVRAM